MYHVPSTHSASPGLTAKSSGRGLKMDLKHTRAPVFSNIHQQYINYYIPREKTYAYIHSCVLLLDGLAFVENGAPRGSFAFKRDVALCSHQHSFNQLLLSQEFHGLGQSWRRRQQQQQQLLCIVLAQFPRGGFAATWPWLDRAGWIGLAG